MVRLVKGAKWIYGWVVAGPGRAAPIPPDAWKAYSFRAGQEAIFTPGSSTSGGFGVSTPALMARVRRSAGGVELRELCRGRFGGGWVSLPTEVAVEPGARLLAVHGSGNALGVVTRGPICEEAARHPEIPVFELDDSPGRQVRVVEEG